MNECHSLYYQAEEVGITHNDIKNYYLNMIGQSKVQTHMFLKGNLWKLCVDSQGTLIPKLPMKHLEFRQFMRELIFMRTATDIAV